MLLLTNKATEDVRARKHIIKLLRSRATLSQDLLETRKLLSGITLVLAKLLSGLDIVLSVLILKTFSSLLEISSELVELASGDILSNDYVQDGDGTGELIKTAADGAVGASLLVQELNKGLLGAGAGVGLGLSRAFGEELDGGVSGYALLLGQGAGVLGFGVDLCDDDIGFKGEVIGEGFPGWGKGLAV
jgi:hypothetical protein